MAPRLGQHALARIDQQHRHVRGRRAGDHVARILFVPRRIGDDELAPGARKEAIGDVDGDALLALGRQPVDQQREIDPLALRAMALAVPSSAASWSSKICFDSYSSRPIRVDLPSSTLPQVMKRSSSLASCWASQARTSVRISSSSESSGRDIRNIPPASSSPCWRCRRRGRSPGPGAPTSWSAASRRRFPRPSPLRSRPRRTADSSRACGSGPCA